MAGEQPKKITGGAFGRFLAEQRPKLTLEFKGQACTMVVKAASERYKALNTSEKAKYEQQYQQAKEKYAKDLAAFMAGGGEMKGIKRKADKDDKKAAKKLKKMNKDPNAPKKVCGGAYGCYLDKHRQAIMKETAGQPITAVSKIAGERWKALSASEKVPFEAAYATKKAAYDTAMKSYVPPVQEEGAEAPVSPKEAKKAAKAEAKADAVKAKEEKKAAKTEAKTEKGGKSAAVKAAIRGKKTGPPALELQPAVLAKAEKAGLKDVLVKLATRDDIKGSGKSEMQMLKALEDNGGLLHPARRALLGC